MEKIRIQEEDLTLVFIVNENKTLSLVHFSSEPFDDADLENQNLSIFQPVELKLTGLDIPGEKHGPKYSLTSPGYRLTYIEHRIEQSIDGKQLIFELNDLDTNVHVTLYYQFYRGTSIVKCWSKVVNRGDKTVGVEYLSSFSLVGIGKAGLKKAEEKLNLFIPHNSWQRELDWREYSFADLGMSNTQGDFRRSSGTIGISNVGNWSTKKYLPMGILENRETGSSLFWQIEHNGSWYWEISDQDGYLYLKISGPTEQEAHWWKKLTPSESFVSIPVAVGSIQGSFEETITELTKYRRLIRRKNEDNEKLPVIFNDYMNCLFGEPTTENEFPLIDKAAEAGCEYYCIDCGWYSEGYWWDGVGEWREAKGRFPNGLKEVTDYIKEKDMIPGLWLEIEVMGINSPLTKTVPNDWFFLRHSNKVSDRSRYQLDFRNPDVRTHATQVIDRLVTDYEIGYIKMDYNIDLGIGTDHECESPGVGLLDHNRSYLQWLDEIFKKYPQLVIENCSSGGLRMDYAQLSRHSIQSTSDQEDYISYSTISANAPSGVTPEQAAVWSYPLEDGDEEETIFNMVNSMLLRVHQSGRLDELGSERFALVKEGIDTYKIIRSDLKNGFAYWPIGYSRYEDPWACMGVKSEDSRVYYLAVWRRNSTSDILTIPLAELKNRTVSCEQIYPIKEEWQVKNNWNAASASLSVELSRNASARLFKLTVE